MTWVSSVPASAASITASRWCSCPRSPFSRGRRCEDRHEGRVQFRGPSSCRGYFRNPEATARLIQGEWLDSGDRGYLVDGEIFITGRVKDIIIRAGHNIYPYELEEAVGAIAGIRQGGAACKITAREGRDTALT